MPRRTAKEKAEREAARWIALLEGEDVTLKDHQRFRIWLAKSELNRRAHESVSRTWDTLDLARGRVPIPANDIPPSPDRRRLLVGLSVGGAVLAAGIAVPLLLPDGEVYASTIAEHRVVDLPDGGKVTLSADTRVRITYSDELRLAHLERGEALFEIAPDPARPFVMKTKFGEVRTLGTSFVTRLSPDNARTTVLSGVIEASNRGSSTPQRVIANEEIILGRNQVERVVLDADAAARRIAWRDGMLSFDGETLVEAAREIERQTGQSFVIVGDELRDLRVGGYIRADADAFVEMLTETFQVEARPSQNQTIELRRN
ncbi:FecR family protein [Vitreimonas flagellata]|uniref:FecR family protein n=1 Tax=Vitreimonas flagellata TaxID=2560861 RepID=UPI0010750F53|nr:FecR domain-containing protein [Vitreimonas flagellata]